MKRFDDIEQLFRNRLREDESESNEWLTPPNFILDNAVKIVNEKKKRRRGFIILFFGLLAISVALSQFLGMNTKSNPVSNADNMVEQEPIKETRLEAKNESEALTTSNEGGSSEHQVEGKDILREVKSSKAKAATNPSPINSSRLLNNTGSEQDDLVIDKAEEKHVDGLTEHTEEGPSLVLNIADEVSIDKLNSIVIKELTWKRPLVINDQRFSESNKDPKRENFVFYAFAGSNLSTLNMTDVPPTDFRLTEYDNYYMGYQFGIGSDYRIGQSVHLTASLSFNSYLNKSSFLSNELYDKANEEVQTDGSISYRSSFDISSPLSETSKEFLIDLENYSVEQDHILVHSTMIKERINVLKTTIGIRYDLARLNKIGFSLGSGMSVNTVLGRKNHLKSAVSYENVKMMEEEFRSNDINMLNAVFLSAYVSTGIDYEFNSAWSAIFNAGYERSVGSIRRKDPSSMTKTLQGSINLNVGLQHRF